MFLLKLVLIFALVLSISEGFFLKIFERIAKLPLGKITDDALYLSKYIEHGYIKEARQLSRCGDLPNNAPYLESYSGFITVRKEYNSNIFFWFFPATNKDPSAPVILWLQGGPGNSGLLGLFTEHGPYIIQENLTVVLREHHWAQTFNMIYVDNPVGTGFSFTKNYSGYVTNQEEMAGDMYEFLRQFFVLFHEYKNNAFYIAGQSYAGKWVPSLAHKIHSMGTSVVVNLTGIMVGNGYCDPETMTSYSGHLLSIGLLDNEQAGIIKVLEDEFVELIKKKDYSEKLDDLQDSIFYLINEYTGLNYLYNFLITEQPTDSLYYWEYVSLPQFSKAVHTGNVRFGSSSYAVQRNLQLDSVQSVKSSVTEIMNNYRVLFYGGQLDVIVPYPAILNFLNSIDWKYAKEYRRAERKIWYLKNSTEIAGYVHNVGNFYEVMVRNAGHNVPYDKPEAAFDLVSRFVNNEAYA